ncbi:MAG: DUF6702 family protein [Pirellula sp.]
MHPIATSLSYRPFALLWLALGIWANSSSQALAHPFHLCVGQMKWNTASERWEVSLRLHPQDLESAMSSALHGDQASKKVSTEDVDFPKLATKYLEQFFYVRRSPAAMKLSEIEAILKVEGQASEQEPKEDRSRLTWVGMEQERGWLWIHLEMQVPAVEPLKQKLWMVNRLLVHHVERQENTMAIDPSRGAKYSLQFKKDEEVREMTRGAKE